MNDDSYLNVFLQDVANVTHNRIYKNVCHFLLQMNNKSQYCPITSRTGPVIMFAAIHYKNWRCPRGVMVKVMDCRIVVNEFVLQMRIYVHFRANTLGKGMNPLILPAMG